ncbi:DUF6049 family protein [Gordonia sp. CPCC 205515]|uniref:DUF6049 family protein n=1 Tax=Gordonia sp. CPCC 205515 TaxID=3140791 RepID=UPI003AF3F29C
MREPQPHAISVATNRPHRRGLGDAGDVPGAPRPAMPEASIRRFALLCAALVSTLLFVALSAAPALAEPSATPATDTIPSTFLRLDIESITPSLVTSSGGAVVTVTGQVANVGDRDLHDLTIRLERGDQVPDAAGLRSSLAVTPTPVAVATPFQPLTDELPARGSLRFQVSAPISGDNGLNIEQVGVYPLQINVNGLPDYGNRAKLAESRTLLPVLSLPPNRARAAGYVDPAGDDTVTDTHLGPDGSVSANLSSPAQFTLVWPLAAPPQLTPGVLGARTEPVRLTGDQLAGSLAPGGRLHTLLDAARSVAGQTDDTDSDASGSSSTTTESDTTAGDESGTSESDAAPRPASKLQQSMCLGVDPDLLVTVRAMSLGYVVSTDPMDPSGPTTPGTGTPAALQWLTELQELAGQMCVVALPFAQADLTSLARIDTMGLTAAALTGPADIVDAILGVRSVRGLTIPALGAVDATGAGVLRSASVDAAVTSATSVATARTTAAGRYRVGDLHVQTVDQPVTAALAGIGSAPTNPALTPRDQQVSYDGESAVARRQAAIGALAYQTIDAPEPADDDDTTPPALPTTGRSAFVMPPTYWAPSADDTNALFSTATVLLESGAAAPAPLPDVIADLGRVTAGARLVPPDGVEPLGTLGMAVDQNTATTIRTHVEESWQLQASLMQSADVAATPERYVAPLREDMLRAIRSPDTASPNLRADLTTQRQQRIAAADSTLARMLDSVTILDPGGRYTLASERSPLLLVVRNDLALPIRVRMNIDAPPELEVGDVGVIEIPARGTRQIQLPTRADTSESMSVTISLTTSSGLAVGSPIRLSVNANAYGKPLFWITVAAGIALVALTARRLWHRFRGEPDPADEDRPDPDEHDRLLAAQTYQQRRRTVHDTDWHEPGEHDTDPSDSPPDHPDPTERDPS